MSSTSTICSHKMARLQRRRKRQQRQSARLELLPVELQLTILEKISSCEDLVSVVASSPTVHAVYDQYRKTILAQVMQATLGDAFVEACMLQHWQNNLDTYRKDEDSKPNNSLTVPPERWPRGPYRHIQLKFLHDWNEHATASTDDQIQNMKHLLTAEDFEQIQEFYVGTIKPLLGPFIQAPAPEHDYTTVFTSFEEKKEPTPLEPRHVTATERERIMRTMYRHEICCQLYGPDVKSGGQGYLRIIDMGSSHRQMMSRDFFGMFDASENEEFEVVYVGLALEMQKCFHLIKDDEAWKTLLRAHTLGAVFSFGLSHWFSMYDMRTRTPIGPRGVTAGALSMGLELLSTIRSAATADLVAAILVASHPPELSNHMWDALSSLKEAYHFSFRGGGDLGWPESWSDEFWA